MEAYLRNHNPDEAKKVLKEMSDLDYEDIITNLATISYAVFFYLK